MFERQPLGDVLLFLLPGLWTTARLAVVAAVIGFAAGTLFGVAAAWGPAWVRWPLNVLLGIARGIPLVVQVFAIYFGLPSFGVQPSALGSAAAALVFFTAMTTMEVVRGGIAAVPPGQLLAARALGMRFGQAVASVVLPQALRVMLPPLVNQLVLVIKATAIASFVGVADMMLLAKESIERTQMGFETMALVWLLYTVVCLPLTVAGRRLETRLQRGFVGGS